jgi:hypothetical protein
MKRRGKSAANAAAAHSAQSLGEHICCCALSTCLSLVKSAGPLASANVCVPAQITPCVLLHPSHSHNSCTATVVVMYSNCCAITVLVDLNSSTHCASQRLSIAGQPCSAKSMRVLRQRMSWR